LIIKCEPFLIKPFGLKKPKLPPPLVSLLPVLQAAMPCRRWIVALCSPLLVHLASADEAAANNLPEMLQKIDSGEFANNFFDGEVLKGKAKDDLEAVAGCLLDKVGAIVEENGEENGVGASFVNDLQVDLAACCTKDREACTEEVAPAYAMLAQVAAGTANSDDVSGHIAALLLEASRKRVKADRVKKSHAKYLGRCTGAPAECTMKSLSSKTEL